MKTLYLILYAVSFVLFAIAIFLPSPVVGAATRPRTFSLVAAGLAVWVLVDVIRQFDIVAD